MSGKYGGADRIFPSPVDGGKKLYWEINSKTGEAELYERKKPELPIKLGTKKPGEKFEVHDPPFPQRGFYEVFNEEQRKEFLNDENQKKLNDHAVKTAKDGCIEVPGSTKAACAQKAQELLDTGVSETPPDATSDEVANESSNKFKEELAKIENEVGTNIGITQEIGSKGLRYPTDMADNQDVIKFSLIKYKANKPKMGATFGRERISPNAKVGNGDRLILGTVILPVPGQIQDTNRADWSDDSANAGQLAVGGLFGAAATGGDVGAEFTKMSDAVVGNSKQAQAAITGALGNTATGVNLLGRMGGLVINPNLELLFSKPSLREFSLNFRLSARSSAEGQEVIKIIRFFKQGMAPIREPSNLFLKAPNTFQVHYLLRGDTSGEHPFIGRMKECALTSVNTNYTPENNYATYEDGLMVSYQISLTLKELEPVYNDNYQDIPDTEIGF